MRKHQTNKDYCVISTDKLKEVIKDIKAIRLGNYDIFDD